MQNRSISISDLRTFAPHSNTCGIKIQWTQCDCECFLRQSVHRGLSQLLFISINRLLINWYLLPSFHLSLGDSLSETDGASVFVSCQCLCVTFLKGTQALQIMSFSTNTFHKYQMFFFFYTKLSSLPFFFF